MKFLRCGAVLWAMGIVIYFPVLNSQHPVPVDIASSSLAVWATSCFDELYEYKVPVNLESGGVRKFPETKVSEDLFIGAINHTIEHYRSVLNIDEKWVSHHAPLFVKDDDTVNFEMFLAADLADDIVMVEHPYAQALTIENNQKLVVVGDIHGSIHSMLRLLLRLKWKHILNDDFIIHPDYKFVFTGDYTDRGRYGIEVWLTLMWLLLKNPLQVFLLRGNHETMPIARRYGFSYEVFDKFGRDTMEKTMKMFGTLYSLLPSAVIIGTRDLWGEVNFIQFCHGGIDPFALFSGIPGSLDYKHPWFDVRPLLDRVITLPSNFDRYLFFEGVSINNNGLLWNDFYTTSDLDELIALFFRGRCNSNFVLHGLFAQDFLRNFMSREDVYRTSAIMRGHEHVPGGVNQLSYHSGVGGVPSCWTPLANGSDVACRFFSNDDDRMSFPIFTFVSAPEGLNMHDEGFGIVEFNVADDCWHLKSFVFDTIRTAGDDVFAWKIGVTSEKESFFARGWLANSSSWSFDSLEEALGEAAGSASNS